MKKMLLVAAATLLLFSVSNAQELGIRFGNVTGGDVAVDGIFSLAKYSRVHADVSFGNGMGAEALWDFIYKPLGTDAFNWYAGVGPYIWVADPFYLGAVGEIGLEYRFKEAPVALGLDWRPALSIIEKTDFYFQGFGLNVRYVFGKK
jgi:hypothetical protein